MRVRVGRGHQAPLGVRDVPSPIPASAICPDPRADPARSRRSARACACASQSRGFPSGARRTPPVRGAERGPAARPREPAVCPGRMDCSRMSAPPWGKETPPGGQNKGGWGTCDIWDGCPASTVARHPSPSRWPSWFKEQQVRVAAVFPQHSGQTVADSFSSLPPCHSQPSLPGRLRARSVLLWAQLGAVPPHLCPEARVYPFV